MYRGRKVDVGRPVKSLIYSSRHEVMVTWTNMRAVESEWKNFGHVLKVKGIIYNNRWQNVFIDIANDLS